MICRSSSPAIGDSNFPQLLHVSHNRGPCHRTSKTRCSERARRLGRAARNAPLVTRRSEHARRLGHAARNAPLGARAPLGTRSSGRAGLELAGRPQSKSLTGAYSQPYTAFSSRSSPTLAWPAGYTAPCAYTRRPPVARPCRPSASGTWDTAASHAGAATLVAARTPRRVVAKPPPLHPLPPSASRPPQPLAPQHAPRPRCRHVECPVREAPSERATHNAPYSCVARDTSYRLRHADHAARKCTVQKAPLGTRRSCLVGQTPPALPTAHVPRRVVAKLPPTPPHSRLLPPPVGSWPSRLRTARQAVSSGSSAMLSIVLSSELAVPSPVM